MIVWAETWSDEQINKVRREENKRRAKDNKGIANFLKRLFK